MSTLPPSVGDSKEPSTVSPDFLDELRAAEDGMRHDLPRLEALADRREAKEGRLRVVAQPPSAPPLAVRCDGAILLCVHDLDKRSIEGRTLWISIVLTPDEADFALRRMDDRAQEIAARIGHSLAKKTEPHRGDDEHS